MTTAYKSLPRRQGPCGSAGLTPRQAAVLRFVGRFLARRGRPPTFREVAAYMGSPNSHAAFRMVRTLAKKGVLRAAPRRGPIGPRTVRGIELVGLAPKLAAIVTAHVEELIAGAANG